MRVRRTLLPTGSGGGICTLGSADELETGDSNNALLAVKAGLGLAGERYRSAKLAVDVTGESTRRNRSTNSVEMSRVHGSDPAAQGLTEVGARAEFRRPGGDASTELYIAALSASAEIASRPSTK